MNHYFEEIKKNYVFCCKKQKFYLHYEFEEEKHMLEMRRVQIEQLRSRNRYLHIDEPNC